MLLVNVTLAIVIAVMLIAIAFLLVNTWYIWKRLRETPLVLVKGPPPDGEGGLFLVRTDDIDDRWRVAGWNAFDRAWCDTTTALILHHDILCHARLSDAEDFIMPKKGKVKKK